MDEKDPSTGEVTLSEVGSMVSDHKDSVEKENDADEKLVIETAYSTTLETKTGSRNWTSHRFLERFLFISSFANSKSARAHDYVMMFLRNFRDETFFLVHAILVMCVEVLDKLLYSDSHCIDQQRSTLRCIRLLFGRGRLFPGKDIDFQLVVRCTAYLKPEAARCNNRVVGVIFNLV
jgi:hypothetical protein